MKKQFITLAATLLLAGCTGNHSHSYTETTVAGTLDTKGYVTYTCKCGDNYTEYDLHSPKSIIEEFAKEYFETEKTVIKDTVVETGAECYEVAYTTTKQHAVYETVNLADYFDNKGGIKSDVEVGNTTAYYTYTTKATDFVIEANIVDDIVFVYAYMNTNDTMPFPQGLR